MLRAVEPSAVQEFPVQATMKLPESLWKRVKIEAIQRGCTVSEFAQQLFETALRDSEPKRKKAREEK
ncbi:MAG: hypothetical protein A2V88_16025 [Elusimicrobia bacterium RBG_16_66_12]|nr:MAG: hypothetical protein A2V88_16025 [Elusimicrobia bacterium RBG_16_66_12]